MKILISYQHQVRDDVAYHVPTPAAISLKSALLTGAPVGEVVTLGSHDEIWSAAKKKGYEPPDVLLIMESDDSSYVDGVSFLRSYWAALLKHETKMKFPPVIYLSCTSLQDLLRKDLRHFILCAGGVTCIQMPCSLGGILLDVEGNAGKSIQENIVRKQLKKSCELRMEGLVEHARRNFMAQYLLLLGANLAGDVIKDDLDKVKSKLNDFGGEEEIDIFYSTITKRDGQEDTTTLPEHRPGVGCKVLLIDNECRKYSETEYCGWTDVFTKIFGAKVLSTVGKDWPGIADMLTSTGEGQEKTYNLVDGDILSALTLPKGKVLLPYDLILLDLYLTKEDDNKRQAEAEHPDRNYSGMELLRAIKKIDRTVPVIMFTASDKAFNFAAAKKDGAAGYFQKEARSLDEEKAAEYYRGLKTEIQNNLHYRVKVMRALWAGIAQYRNGPGPDLELANLLEVTWGTLKMGSLPSLKAVGVLLGNILDLLEERKDLESYSLPFLLHKRIKEGVTTRRSGGLFMVKHLRNSVAHSTANLRFEDGCLALYYVLQSLGVAVDFKYPKPLVFNSISTVDQLNDSIRKIVFSVCKKACACPGELCSSKIDKDKFECCGMTESPEFKAAMLATHTNFDANEYNQAQALFGYLFFCLNLKEEINTQVLNLILSRLVFYSSPKSYLPWQAEGTGLCWRGVVKNGKLQTIFGELAIGGTSKITLKESSPSEGATVGFDLNPAFFREPKK